MHLEKVVLSGFKSFADKTTFAFPHQLTAIVGPNGSGKSNVADAVRWVLGEQSIKLLRGKRASDVIFAGSPKRARLGFAQVEMYLNNEDGRLPVDYSEVVISRRVYRSGESEYLLNKKPVRLSEILLLLAKANFGQKSYAVIGQGMVDHIVSSSPQDRKDFFDEATGVKEFQMKRDKSVRKLIRTEDHLQQTETLLAEIEPRLKSLKRQVKKLEQREKLAAELGELQVSYYGTLWTKLERDVKVKRGESGELKKKRTKLEKELAAKQGEIDAMEKEETRSEAFLKLQSEQNEIIRQKNTFLKDQVLVRGKMEVEQTKQGKLNIVWMQRRQEDLTADIDRIETEISGIDSFIKREEKAETLEASNKEELTEKVKELEYETLKLKQDIQNAVEDITIDDVRTRLESLFDKQEGFLKKLLETSSLEAFKDMQKEASALTKEMAKLLDELRRKEKIDVSEQQARLSELEENLQTLAGQRATVTDKLNELRVSVQSLKEKRKLLLEKKEEVKAEREKIKSDLDVADTKDDSKDETQKKLKAQLKEIQGKIEKLETKLEGVNKHISEFNKKEEAKRASLYKLQREARGVQTNVNEVAQSLSRIMVDVTRLDTKLEDLEHEMNEELLEAQLTQVRKETHRMENIDQGRVQILKLKRQLELIGGIDPETIQEHEDTEERFNFLDAQVKDLRKSSKDLETIIDELDEAIKTKFNKQIKNISKDFSRFFTTLFQGGTAKLKLVTEEEQEKEEEAAKTEAEKALEEAKTETEGEEPEEEDRKPSILQKKKRKIISGIELQANPPGKKLENVNVMSGGEKAMTALALLSAIMANNPSPFVVLDEVDAALDEANSEKFTHILKELSKNSQFLVITHNRAVMNATEALYGVTMGSDGASNILSVSLDQAEAMSEK